MLNILYSFSDTFIKHSFKVGKHFFLVNEDLHIDMLPMIYLC